MPDNDDKKYLTLEEVADLLGVNYQLIYRLVRSGELPAIRLGRVYRIERADLEEYLDRSKTSRTQTGGVCSACGRTYASRLSLSEECAECGSPICVDCWQREGVRACREHGAESVPSGD